MNRTMNQDTAENRDCSNDTDHVKKDKGAYAEPLPESFRPRRDGRGGELGFKREKSQTDKRLPAFPAWDFSCFLPGTGFTYCYKIII